MTAGAATRPGRPRATTIPAYDRSRACRHHGRTVTSVVDRQPGIPFALCRRLQRVEEIIVMPARQLGSNLLHKFLGGPSPRRKAGCPREALGTLSPTHLTRSRTRTAGTDQFASPRPVQGRLLSSARLQLAHRKTDRHAEAAPFSSAPRLKHPIPRRLCPSGALHHHQTAPREVRRRFNKTGR